MAEKTSLTASISISWPVPDGVQPQVPLTEALLLHRPPEQQGQAGGPEVTLHNLAGVHALFLQASARAVEVLLAENSAMGAVTFSYSTTVRLKPAGNGPPGMFEGAVPLGQHSSRGIRLRLASLIDKQLCTISQLRLEHPDGGPGCDPVAGNTGSNSLPAELGHNAGQPLAVDKDGQAWASMSPPVEQRLLSQAEQMRLLLRAAAGGIRDGDPGYSSAEALPPSLQALAERMTANTRGPGGNILKAMAQSALALQGQGFPGSLMREASPTGAGTSGSPTTSREQGLEGSTTAGAGQQPHSQAPMLAPAADASSSSSLLQAVLLMGQTLQGQLGSLQAAVQRVEARVQGVEERLHGIEQLLQTHRS
jgi:hypothetical protein